MCLMQKRSLRKNYISHYRKLRNMTQDELSEAVGTSQTQIMRLETGLRKFTLEWAERVAVPLLCTPIDLMFGPDHDLNTDERKALSSFRALPTNERDRFLLMMESASQKWKNKS